MTLSEILAKYPHIVYKDCFNEKSTTDDFFSFQNQIQSLSPEFDEFELEVLIGAWYQRSSDYYTFDYNCTLQSQYLYYDVRMKRKDGFIYYNSVSTDINYYGDSLNLNKIKTTVGFAKENIIDIFNKILIDKKSSDRVICLSDKQDSSNAFILAIPQETIYKIYETDKFYIYGIWRDGTLAWNQIENTINLLKECEIIDEWSIEQELVRIKQQSYLYDIFYIIGFFPNKIIFSDLGLYFDNSENGITAFVKDLSKLSKIQVEEIDEDYDEEAEMFKALVKFSGTWFDFSIRDNDEIEIVKRYNSMLNNIGAHGRIYQLEIETATAFMYLLNEQREKMQQSGIFQVNDIV